MIQTILGQAGDKLYTFAAFAVVLGIIIFVHEFGHFVTAKLFKMRVFIFSFGFGKRLFGFKRGDTDYRLSLVPLGGYVKLEGEPDDYLSESTAQEGDQKDFLARPRWQRFLVYVAGPAMNVVLTIGLLTGLYMAGIPERSEQQARPIIGSVDPGSPAEQAGLAPTDRIVAVDGKAISRWEELLLGVGLSPDHPVRLTVQRNGATREIEVQPRPEGRNRLGDIGVHPLIYVLEVVDSSPAQAAGIQVDDAIIRIDERAIREPMDVAAAITGGGGRAVALSIFRDGQVREIRVAPGADGKIGILPGYQSIVRRLGASDAFVAAVRQTWQLTQTIADVVRRLLTGRVSVRQVEGPLGIARASGQAAREGTLGFLLFIAFISLNVGLLNLFPLTPLDGGHLLILATESLMRRDLNMRIKVWISYAGVAAVLMLLVVVFYSDIAKMIAAP